MYNPWYNILVKQGTGTLSYQGSWNLFDQIVMTPNLVNTDGKKDFSTLKYWKKPDIPPRLSHEYGRPLQRHT